MYGNQPNYITVDQLRIGLYVHLDLGWMAHSFLFSNFKIKNDEQIADIRKLGLKTLRYDPLRSDCDPLPQATQPTAVRPPEADRPEAEQGVPSAAQQASAETPPIAKETQQFHAKRLRELHQAIHECEKSFVSAATTVRHSTRNLLTQPKEVLHEVGKLITGMVDSVITESDVVLHLMSGKNIGEEHYIHSLNVTVLSLTLAKSLDMTAEDAEHLGLAAIFHDIGKAEIPDRVLRKTDPLTMAEQFLLEQHAEIGARMARECGMQDWVANIILQHHECMDGSGYPRRLKEAQIDPPARLIGIINMYDNLCNPLNPADAMTPYEALSYMFATQRNKFDASMLKLLIKSLGVYPPGSIVYLSTGVHGIVVSVNPRKPLRPFVMLHMPEIPQENPMMVDLSEQTDITISKCLRLNQLPKDAFDYLNPSKRITYFFNKDKPAAPD